MGLSFANIFSRLFAKKEMRVFKVGLDAAGKTTILYKMNLGEIVTTVPIIGFNAEILEYKNIKFGHCEDTTSKTLRGLYSWLIAMTVEARDELHMMLNEDELRDVVLLVFANKEDLPNVMNVAEIIHKLASKA